MTNESEPNDSTAELKAQLLRTTAELERCRKEAEEFHRKFSRDLRTGLNCILGFAELLDMRSSGIDRSNIKQILNAGRELLGLIDAQTEPLTPAAEAKRRHGCDVLYIEDNEANFILVQHIFAARPRVSLQRADRGETGIVAAYEQQPRLILLDLNLPDMHGADVLHLLRLRPETATIPVVVISADATPSQIERLLSAGARNYLTKPFRIEPMLAIVDEVLEQVR